MYSQNQHESLCNMFSRLHRLLLAGSLALISRMPFILCTMTETGQTSATVRPLVHSVQWPGAFKSFEVSPLSLVFILRIVDALNKKVEFVTCGCNNVVSWPSVTSMPCTEG